MTLSDKAKTMPEAPAAREVYLSLRARRESLTGAAARRSKSPTLAEIADAQSIVSDWASAISDEQSRVAR
jgi:hypothetical protein